MIVQTDARILFHWDLIWKNLRIWDSKIWFWNYFTDHSKIFFLKYDDTNWATIFSHVQMKLQAANVKCMYVQYSICKIIKVCRRIEHYVVLVIEWALSFKRVLWNARGSLEPLSVSSSFMYLLMTSTLHHIYRYPGQLKSPNHFF